MTWPRGLRPLENAGERSGGRIDIGALEVDMAQSSNTFAVNNATDDDDGFCTDTNCSLREAINAANAHAGADVIEMPIDVTLGSALPVLSGNVTIQGTPVAGSRLSDG